MDFRQLRYFVEIAEAGSLSRAAETLRIAQPSLSQHIRNLEMEFGVDLLNRHARGVTLTDFGALLYAHGRDILREMSRTKELVLAAKAQPIGEVRVGLPTSACRGLAIPLIDAVAARYPGISLHLVEAMSGSLAEWVSQGRVDVALLYDYQAADSTITNDLTAENLLLIVSMSDPMVGFEQVSFAQLSSRRIALPSRPHVIRDVIERMGMRVDALPNVEVNCDSFSGLVKLVQHGCVTILPQFAVRDEIVRGEVKAIPIVNPTPSWRLSVVLSKRSERVRIGETVAYLMHQVIREMMRNGEWPGFVQPRSPNEEEELPLRQTA